MIPVALALLAAAWVCFASTPVAAATCKDTDVARPKDLADFCSAMTVVETYLSTYAAQNPGKGLPAEAAQKLNVFIPTFLNRANEYDASALLVKLAPELTVLIQNAPTHILSDPSVRAALNALRGGLNGGLYHQPVVSEAGLYLDIVTKIFADPAAATIFGKDQALVVKVSNAIDLLTKILPFHDKFLDQVKNDTVALTKKVTQGTPQLVEDGTLASPVAVPELKKLRAAIDKVTVALTPRIHIYYAYFGDLGASASGNRICDATSTMRARCEAGVSCKLPDAFETKLCGYNPVPFVEARDRGAVVSYGCQIGGEALWTENVRIKPGKLMAPGMPKPVILQSTEMEIACARTP